MKKIIIIYVTSFVLAWLLIFITLATIAPKIAEFLKANGVKGL